MPCGKEQKHPTGSSNSASCTERSSSQAPCPDKREKDNNEHNWLIFQDSMKADVAQFEDGADDSDEVEEKSDWEELDNEDFASHVVAMVLDDDPKTRTGSQSSS